MYTSFLSHFYDNIFDKTTKGVDKRPKEYYQAPFWKQKLHRCRVNGALTRIVFQTQRLMIAFTSNTRVFTAAFYQFRASHFFVFFFSMLTQISYMTQSPILPAIAGVVYYTRVFDIYYVFKHPEVILCDFI